MSLTKYSKNLKAQFSGNSNSDESVNILKPEHILKDQIYAVTISPNDLYALVDCFDKSSIHHFQKQWTNIFDRMMFDCHLKLHCEYSSSMRFHFHGTIKINNVLNFYGKWLPLLKEMSNIDMDTIDSSYPDPESDDDEIPGIMKWDLYSRKMQIIEDGDRLFPLIKEGFDPYYDNHRLLLRLRGKK